MGDWDVSEWRSAQGLGSVDERATHQVHILLQAHLLIVMEFARMALDLRLRLLDPWELLVLKSFDQTLLRGMLICSSDQAVDLSYSF